MLPLDVTDSAQIEDAVAKAIAMSSVDVVFNNAGYGMAGPLEGLTDEQIVRMVNTNLLGAIRITKAFVPHFREKKAGLFITTTSIGGLIAVPFNSMYHATKWGLEGFCESMAFELKRFGIGMKTIEPGGMKTDFFTRSFDSGSHHAYGGLIERVMGMITDPTTMASYSTPEQIADVVYEAATDGKEQLRYVAGADAKRPMRRAFRLETKRFAREWISSSSGSQHVCVGAADAVDEAAASTDAPDHGRVPEPRAGRKMRIMVIIG